jgi:hypothetical protein
LLADAMNRAATEAIGERGGASLTMLNLVAFSGVESV